MYPLKTQNILLEMPLKPKVNVSVYTHTHAYCEVKPLKTLQQPVNSALIPGPDQWNTCSQFYFPGNLLVYIDLIRHFTPTQWVIDTYINSTENKTYIALMLSVRFVSKERNCFPLFVKPLISDPAARKIFSWGVLRTPPSSSLEIFCPGKVLNTGCKNQLRKKLCKSYLIVNIFLYDKSYDF